MASKKLLCILIVYFFALGSATYCNDDSDCFISESCCSDKVCRQRCYYCCTSTGVERMSNAVITNAPVVRPLVPVLTTTSVKLASSAVIANASVVRLLAPVPYGVRLLMWIEREVLLLLYVRLRLWHWRRLLWGSLFVIILWLEWRSYCRRYYRHNYILRHHHFHCVLSLLCLLPVLPLSYTRYCGRHRPTATTTNGLNSHTWRRNKYMFLRRWTTISLLQLVTTRLLKALIRLLRLTRAIHRHQTNILHRRDKLKRRRYWLQ